MVDRRTQEEEGSNTKKDPDDWTTGEEPMTGAQRSYMHTLAEEAHEEVSDDLTKAEASKKSTSSSRKRDANRHLRTISSPQCNRYAPCGVAELRAVVISATAQITIAAAMPVRTDNLSPAIAQPSITATTGLT